jgi:hypothetical protein
MLLQERFNKTTDVRVLEKHKAWHKNRIS